MKTFVILAMIIFGSIYEGYCQWIWEDSYKKMVASDTSIIQMEISEDGNFIFIIDKLYNLKKFDAATGNKVSEISLKSVDLGTYKFSNAKLTKGGSQYYVYGDYKDSVLVFIFDIEKDLILNQLYLRRNLFSYQKYGLYNVTIQNDILFLNQIHQYFTSYGKQASSEQWGYSEVYKIQNYTTQLLNMKSGGMERNTLINKNSFFTVYYTDYEDFFMDNLKPLHNFNFRELMLFNRYTNQFRRIKYIEDNKETYNKPNTEMNLSHYGNLSSFQFYDTLFVYDNIKNINIVKEIYKAVISSMTFSNDNKYLIFATGNKIITKTSNDLKKVDSLVFSKIPSKIESITLGKDEPFSYFYSGNNIYKCDFYYNTNELKASYFVDFDVHQANHDVRFINTSSGEPVKYYWDFRDGNISEEENPVHKYKDTGFYNVKMKIFDDKKSDEIEIEKAVRIIPEIKSNFSFAIDENTCPVTVKFTNKSEGLIDSVLWKFNNNITSKEYDPEFKFYYSGTYRINLKIYSFRFIHDTTIEISINVPDRTIDNSLFAYERILNHDTNATIYQSYEGLDQSIIFNSYKKSKSSVYKMDVNGNKVWELDSVLTAGNLEFIDFNNYCFSSNNIITRFNILDYSTSRLNIKNKIQFLKYKVPNYYIISNPQQIGSGIGYKLMMYDYDLNFINESNIFTKNMTIVEIVYFSNHINLDFNGNQNDILIDYNLNYIYYDNNNDPISMIDYAIYYNDKLLFDEKNLDFIAMLRLNANNLIVAWNNGKIISYNNDMKENWHVPISQNQKINYFLKLNDTCFAAFGSIDRMPGFILYNDKGGIISTTTVDCRFGSFNHASFTPDTNLLMSGYLTIDTSGKTIPYIIKSKSKEIKERIHKNSIYSGVEEISQGGRITISPNPATDYITINHDNKGLKPFAETDVQVEIYNSFGELVFEDVAHLNRIDVSYLPVGLYFIKIGNKVEKFVKM